EHDVESHAKRRGRTGGQQSAEPESMTVPEVDHSSVLAVLETVAVAIASEYHQRIAAFGHRQRCGERIEAATERYRQAAGEDGVLACPECIADGAKEVRPPASFHRELVREAQSKI